MTDERFVGTGGCASGAVDALFDDDPTWQHSTVPTSEHAAKRGSQASVWMLGIPRPAGFSEDVSARQPLAAGRRAPPAASPGSKSGTIAQGTKRPRYAPH